MNSQSGILRVFALFSLLACLSSGLNAQNILWVDSLSSGPRQQVEFLVNIMNADTIVAVQCDVVFPVGLSYVNNSVHMSTRASGHTLSASMISSTTLRILVYSLTGAALEGNSGPVVSFACQAGIQPGTFSLHVANVVLGNRQNSNILTQAYDGQLILLAPSIKTNADSVDFGSVALGQSSGFQLTINNSGNLPLSLQSISSSLSEIAALDSSSSSIGPGLSITRDLRFQPGVKGMKNGVMTLKSNDPKDSVKIVKVHGYAYAVNEIHVGSAPARSGHQATLRLRVNNMEQFPAFQCKILLPPVMKYVHGSAELVGRSVDHVISADTSAGNVLQLVCYSPTNTSLEGSDGEIAQLEFQVEGQGGTYALPVTEALIADSTGGNILSASYGGELRIAAPSIQLSTSTLSLGSVSIFDTAHASLQLGNSGDDTLKVTSATMIDPGYALETTLPLFVLPGSNQALNIRFHNGARGSFSTPITIVHNDVPRNPSHVTASASTFIPNKLRIVSVTGCPADTVSVALSLENAEPITALQFDVHMPGGAVFIPASLVKMDRSTSHSLSSSTLANGALRVIMFSLTQATFTGSTGEVARLEMKLPDTEGAEEIALDNVLVSNTANQNVVSCVINGTIDNYVAYARGWCWPAVGVASGSFLNPTDIHFVADVTKSAEMCASFFTRIPRSSSLPSGVHAASSYFWNFTHKGVAFTKGRLDVSVSSLAGVSNPSSLVWLKRDNPDEPWANLGGNVADGRLGSVEPFSSLSEFAIGTTSPENPLPVQINGFDARLNGGTVMLSWTTASELENYGFEVERRLVGGQDILGSFGNSVPGLTDERSDWHTIGFVRGSGTTNAQHNYVFEDAVSPGQYSYRLKQIDADGRIQIGEQIEVRVQLRKGDYGLTQNYPNPFNLATTFQFAVKSAGDVDLSVYNSLGQRVCTPFNGTTKSGILYSVPFDAKDLSSGTYFYILKTNDTYEVRKFLLLK